MLIKHFKNVKHPWAVLVVYWYIESQSHLESENIRKIPEIPRIPDLSSKARVARHKNSFATLMRFLMVRIRAVDPNPELKFPWTTEKIKTLKFKKFVTQIFKIKKIFCICICICIWQRCSKQDAALAKNFKNKQVDKGSKFRKSTLH